MCDYRWEWTEERQQLNVASRLSLGSECRLRYSTYSTCRSSNNMCLTKQKKNLGPLQHPQKNSTAKEDSISVIFFLSLRTDRLLILSYWDILFACLNSTIWMVLFVLCSCLVGLGFFYRIKIVTSLHSCHPLPFLSRAWFCCFFFLMCSWCKFILAMHLMSLVSVTSS